MSNFHKDGQIARKPENAVFTNMVMIEDSKGNVLVQRRTRGWNGLVFPGGHLKEKETATDSAIRESQPPSSRLPASSKCWTT